MDLLLPKLMDHLDRKEIMIAQPTGMPFPIDRKSRYRPTHLMPLLHQSQKFVFDSGSDKDERTTSAVRETAVNMLEAGLFHLPFPLIWIEDPFDDNPSMRFLYLCRETKEGITMWFFQSLPKGTTGRDGPRFCFFEKTAFISFEEITDKFMIEDTHVCDPMVGNSYAEAIYALKKFIVCLNSEDIIRERVDGKPFRPGLPKQFRQYEHSIIRVPFDRADAAEHGIAGESRRRRKHLVRGFVWGKNTRPREQQRWIKPFWRGSQEVGEIKREHYEVG